MPKNNIPYALYRVSFLSTYIFNNTVKFNWLVLLENGLLFWLFFCQEYFAKNISSFTIV